MQLVVKPRVRLVGRSVMDIDGLEEFLGANGLSWPALQEKFASDLDLGDQDGEWIVEAAGRVCYESFGRGRSHEDYLKHIIEVGHGSVLEHANYNFMIWGVSRTLTHELVRHRAGFGYSQLSQRYVDESDTAFVIPAGVQALERENPALYQRVVDHMQASRDLYADLTTGLMDSYAHIEDKTDRRKKARSAARSVLPNATETKMFVTANARALRHFVEMRAHPAAELEIRQLAVEIFRIMAVAAPGLFYGMKIVTLPDGTEGVESEFRKV